MHAIPDFSLAFQPPPLPYLKKTTPRGNENSRIVVEIFYSQRVYSKNIIDWKKN